MPEPARPRVIHVITRMVRGGAQENTLATAAGLDPPWESILVTGPDLGPEGSLAAEISAARVRTIVTNALVREIDLRKDFAALRRLTSLLRKERPVVVHTHTSKAGALGRIAAFRAGVPAVIHTPHGHVFHSYEGRLKSRVFAAVERALAPRADRLVALTPRERDEHLDLGIGRPEQWRVIPSGVDFAPFEAWRGRRNEARERLGLSPDVPVIGCVGRLAPIKGQEFLIRAVACLPDEFSDAVLVLVGDGPCAGRLFRLAEELGLRPSRGPSPGARARFVGLRTDVAACMAAFNLLVLPSLNEGMGRVLVEAMAMELPCVGSRIGGIPDVIEDGVTGILAPPGDADGLAAALAELLGDPDRARSMGRAGRRRAVPAFSRERMLASLDALYREVLTEHGLPLPAAIA